MTEKEAPWLLRLAIGLSKLLFSDKKKYNVRQSPLPIFANGCKVEFKDKIKHLGFWLQSNLKPNAHIEHSIGKGYAGLRELYPLLKAKSGLSQMIKCKLYTAIIRPVMTYAVPIWRNHNKTLNEKLIILEKKCIRLAIADQRSPVRLRYRPTESLHAKSKISHLNSFINKVTKDFLNKTYEHNNPIIRSLGNFTSEYYSSMRHKPAHYALTFRNW